MKIRNGFVSNSSSGSFIFPEKYNAYDIEMKLRLLIDFANKFDDTNEYKFESIFNYPIEIDKEFIRVCGEYFSESEDIGRKGLETKYCGRIRVNTANDNSVPYWMHEFLFDKMNATYIHFG